MLFKFISLIALSAFLTACAYWPPEGYGGQAESFETENAHKNELRLQNKTMIECFDRKLQGLMNSDVRYQHPAKLATLSIQWTRVVRAHAGDLNFETKQDLILLQNEFDQLEKSLKKNSIFRLISSPYSNGGTCS